MFRILVVAYDESPISPLVAYVKAEGYTVTVLEDARSRDLIGRQWPFDLIVVIGTHQKYFRCSCH